MQPRVNLVRTGIEANKRRVEGSCEHLSGDAELFIKGELSVIDPLPLEGPRWGQLGKRRTGEIT